jgi:hypothetical protein
MEWVNGAIEGIEVVPVLVPQGSLTISVNPRGMTVDYMGYVYTTDAVGHHVRRWSSDAPGGTIVIGGDTLGSTPDRLICPNGLSFDRRGNLYVVDYRNHR